MQQPADRWNQHVVLHPSDRLFLAVVAPCIPKSVRPNHLTGLRVALVPFVIFFLHAERYGVSGAIFFIAALTDWFDGALARSRRQITEWGIIYDPLADKLLIGAALFMIVLEHVNFFLGIALLVIECGLIAAGLYARLKGVVEPANVWGKIKMVAEVVGVLLLLFALWQKIDLFVNLSTGMLAFALIAALVSIYSRIR